MWNAFLLWFMVIAALTLVLSTVAPVVLTPALKRYGVLDVPNARSSHTVTVVRGLGLGVGAALFVGWIVAFTIFGGLLASVHSYAQPLMFLIILVVFFAGALGTIEDLRGLKVLHRSIAQLGLAFIAALGVCMLFKLPVIISILLVIFGLLYISSFINAANFMDGLNGISALHGIIAGIVFALSGFFAAESWLLVFGALFALAFAGFLPWNLAGRGFLGDVGSYILGAGIAVLSFAALASGVPVLAAIAPTVIYFGDVGWTLLKRVRRGAKWYDAHKEHVYQRLQQQGLSHLGASLVAASCTLLASILGLLSFVFASQPVMQLVLLILGFGVVVFYVNTPSFVQRYIKTI